MKTKENDCIKTVGMMDGVGHKALPQESLSSNPHVPRTLYYYKFAINQSVTRVKNA